MASSAGDVPVGEEGDDVEHGEGDDREQGSAGEPLSCWRCSGGLGAAVAEAEDDGGDDVVEREVAEGDLVEAMLEDSVADQ